MFPGAGAQIYRNEAGEPTGWDQPSYDEGPEIDDYEEPDPDDFDESGAEWVICDDCGNEYEYGDPDAEQHTKETGHDRWS